MVEREGTMCVCMHIWTHQFLTLNALFTNQAAHLHLHSSAPPLVSCLCIYKIGKLISITFFLRAFWSDRDSMQFSEYIVYLTTPYKLYKLVYIHWILLALGSSYWTPKILQCPAFKLSLATWTQYKNIYKNMCIVPLLITSEPNDWFPS
jgi:hypothetical protein